jgi:hypothetical protein
MVRISKKQQDAVEAFLASYESERDASKTSLETKRSILKVRSYLEKMRNELDKLLADPVFFPPGSHGFRLGRVRSRTISKICLWSSISFRRR